MGRIKEHPMQALAAFLPDNTFEQVVQYLHQYKVHLTVTKSRKSVLGDYRNATHNQNHRITVNSDLNKYSFLITLLHELAHLLTFEQYGHKVAPHGKEWKKIYGHLLSAFTGRKIFPADVETELIKNLHSPAASTCAEEDLMRVLRRYNPDNKGLHLVEEIPEGGLFVLKDGRVFQRGEKLRKRYKCEELASKKIYLFSAMYEVMQVQNKR